MAGAAFDARLARNRREVEQLHDAMRGLSRHLQVMRSISGNWDQAVDALQTHLNGALKEATLLRKDTLRTIAEAEALIREAPRGPARNLRVGQPSAPPVGGELRGKIQRLEKDSLQLDRSLRDYQKTVHEKANDPTRHASGAEMVDVGSLLGEPLSQLIGQIGDIVEIFQGFLRKNRR